MLPVSDKYKLKIDATERRCTAKVKIYFDGPYAPPVVFDNHDISRFSLLEEARAESSNPLGRVSANEFMLGLRNTEGRFNPGNVESPFFNKLVPNIKVEPYIGLDVDFPEEEEENIEWLPLGIFWTGDWDAPSAGLEAAVVCYDQLYRLGEIDLPPFAVLRNTTIGGLLTHLLLVLGVAPSEFIIDPTLKQPVRMGWLPRGKAWGAFQELATAGSCTIVSDRLGRIVAINNFRLTNPVVSLDDESQIMDMNIPQRYRNIFTSTLVRCKHPSLAEGEQILSIDKLVVPRGSNVFRGIEFNGGPIASLSQISLRGATTSTIDRISYGAWSIDIRIANTGAEEVVGLYAEGIPITTSESSVSRTNKPLASLYGLREQEIQSDLIQDVVVAREYVSLAGYIGQDPRAYFNINVRGNPAIELLDTITISNPSDRFEQEDVVVLRTTFDYDGALSGTIEGIRKEALIVKDWVFMCPGMYALQPRHFELR